jgi:hypothetical protein
VVKMSVTSGQSAVRIRGTEVAGLSPAGSNAVAQFNDSIACSPPNRSTIRGEDRCYIDCNSRGRGFESRPAFCAPVAQWIERFPLQVTLRAGISAVECSRIVVPRPPPPVVKSAVTSLIARLEVQILR